MIIAPSVLSMDYSRMSEQLNELNQSGAQWIHFDVMDGHFVPNITFGSDILKGFKKGSDLYLDVHVMISDPDFFAEQFIQAGADNYTFHLEAINDMNQVKKLAQKIHSFGASCGLSIKPGTSVDALRPFLHDFDLFLIMSVEPGFGGQKFMDNSLDKIRTLRTWIDAENLNAKIEVDGGINDQTAKLVKDAGVDVIVAGSYFFKNDMKQAVKSLV